VTDRDSTTDSEARLNPAGTTHYLGRDRLDVLRAAHLGLDEPGDNDFDRLRVRWDARLTVTTPSGEAHEYLDWRRHASRAARNEGHPDAQGLPRYAVDGLGALHVFYLDIDMRPTLVRSYNERAWSTYSQPGELPYRDAPDLTPTSY